MNMNRLTQKSQEALQTAQSLAVREGHYEIDVEHLAAALIEQQDGLIPRLLKRMNVEAANMLATINTDLQKRPRVSGPGIEPGKVYISQKVNDLLVQAESEARSLKDEYISVEHLFLAMIEKAHQYSLKTVFKTFDITRERFLSVLTEVRGCQRVVTDNPEDTYEALERFGQDLVKEARAGKLDPVIGRDDEIRRVIRILSRKTKNNPVLIGEPGVGKTAIVEGLAHRIVRGDVPDGLKDKSLFSLDMGSLIAGAKYRGEFEERLKSVLDEVRKSEGQIL